MAARSGQSRGAGNGGAGPAQGAGWGWSPPRPPAIPAPPRSLRALGVDKMAAVALSRLYCARSQLGLVVLPLGPSRPGVGVAALSLGVCLAVLYRGLFSLVGGPTAGAGVSWGARTSLVFCS